MAKSYGLYSYTWRGSQVPFYIGKDSYINENRRHIQHTTISQPRSIIDKALSGKRKTGLVYKVIAKFPDEETMTLAEAVLIDYWHKRDGCQGNIVNELYSPANRKKFWPGYTTPVTISKPTKVANWIKKR